MESGRFVVKGKQSSSGVVLGAESGAGVNTDPVLVPADDLLDLVREEFTQQGDLVPGDDQVLVLARVVAGYLRTSPLPQLLSPGGEMVVAASFVGACLGWWTRDVGDYTRLAALLDDVFHQRESGRPSGPGMEILLALGAGIMRQRHLRASQPAQLAIADWIATLYLAGLDDWA
jgi:hypothetical protein